MNAARHMPMSRPYALARLLEHGALTGEQLRQITGWNAHVVGNTLQALLAEGTVAATSVQGRRCYQLAKNLVPVDIKDTTPARPRARARGCAPATATEKPTPRALSAHNPFQL